MRRKLILALLAVASLSIAPGITWAASIAIETLLTNASFELGPDATCPDSWTCGGSPGPAAYTPKDPQHYLAGTDGISGIVPDGARAAYAPTATTGSGSLKQVTSSTWQSGNTYSFTVWVGVPLTEPNGTTAVTTGPLAAVSISLLAGGSVGNFCGGNACTFDILAAGLPVKGQWKQFIYNPVIDDSVFGQTIGVLLEAQTQDAPEGANQLVNWDMVPTSTTPVPEPATMFLGGLGLIAFGFAARRRLFGR